MSITPCEDHLGNKYKSKAEMCKKHNINKSTLNYWLSKGESLEYILTNRGFNNHKVYDHLKNEFNNIKEMCAFWDIPFGTFNERRKKGWSLQKALETPPRHSKRKCKDHLGNSFNSVKEKCQYHNVDRDVYLSRIKKGWSEEKALTTKVQKRSCKNNYVDADGRQFNTLQKLCDYHNVAVGTYLSRLEKGASIEEALKSTQEKRETKKLTNIKLPPKMNTQGLFSSIIKYNNANDCTVLFEDGTKKNNVRKSDWSRGIVPHPLIKRLGGNIYLCNHTKGTKISSYKGEVYFDCECDKCKSKMLLTAKEFLLHGKECV